MNKKISKLPLILGLSSLVAWVIPILGVIVGVLGIVISKKQTKVFECKAYKIGLILSIIGTVISVIYWIINIYIIMIKFV